MSERSLLKFREKLYATDVKEAILAVLAGWTDEWPVPFVIPQVAAELYKMSLLQEDGTYLRGMSAMAQKQVTEAYLHLLKERDHTPSLVMVSGTQLVEAADASVSIVPVTQYFFTEGFHECRDALEAMSESEAKLCYTGGQMIPRDADGNAIGNVTSRKTAGYIAVRTQGVGSIFARMRLDRMAKQVDGTIKTLEHQAKNAGDTRIEHLAVTTRSLLKL